MKSKYLLMTVMFLSIFFCGKALTAAEDEVGKKTEIYFKELFSSLRIVAEENPTVDNFCDLMRPVAEKTKGFYGATLIDSDFVIRQVYNPLHFLAKGFDLKKVNELKDFYRMMKEHPVAQLSEPGHGSIAQPRLIAMRYPVIRDGKLINIVSMMIHTESFLKATGLDKTKAFRIICLGKLTEQKGRLSKNYKEVILNLPSTEWVIQYEG